MTRTRYTQHARLEFFRKLAEYEEALRTGNNFVLASLQIHQALADVPKSYWGYVGRAFRDTKRVA